MVQEPARVLLIGSDTPDVARIDTILRQEADVHRAADVTTGQAMATAMRPDLIVLDAAAQREDTLDLGDALRRDSRTALIPLLVVPTAEAEGSIPTWLERGATDVLPAPMEPELLLTRMRVLAELRRLREDVARTVHQDSPHGLVNRPVFDSILHRESRRLRRSDGHLGLLLIDIDDLAAYRAMHGEPAGEACFHRVAECAAEQLRRPPDFLCRYGPDQIACLLPETDLRGARVVARTILEAVTALHLPNAAVAHRPTVTVSIGVASRHCSGPEVSTLLRSEARDRLDRARRSGGNRIVTTDSGQRMGRAGLFDPSGRADGPEPGWTARPGSSPS